MRSVVWSAGVVFAGALGTAEAQPPFRAGVELVEVSVFVTDRQGQPVTDLHPSDVEIREDGAVQAIVSFETVRAPAGAARSAGGPPLHQGRDAPEADVRSTQAPDGLLVALVFDELHVDPRGSRAVRDDARRLLSMLQPEDRVMVASAAGNADLLAPPSSRRTAALAALDRFVGRKLRPATDRELAYDLIASMQTLVRVAELLQTRPERRKVLVLFSEGSEYNPHSGESTSQVLIEIERAIRILASSNVALYAFDPRGLVGIEGARAGRNTYDEPRGLLSTDVRRATDYDKLMLSMRGLEHLAESTGGFAAINSNSRSAAIDRLVREQSAYYLVRYYASAEDRSERPMLSVRVKRPGVRVRVRMAR